MPDLEEKIKGLPKKLCKALKAKLHCYSKREKSRKNTDQSVYEHEFSQSVVLAKDCQQSYNFFFTKRTNCMLLTCQDNQDTADLLKTKTFYGAFLASGDIKSHKVFLLQDKDNSSCPHQAVVNFCPMKGKMSRTKSIDSLGNVTAQISLSLTKSISRKVKPNKIEKYSKFIPVHETMGEKYPRGPISDRSLLNWLDVQAWYVNYLEEKLEEVDLLNSMMPSKGMDDMELYRPTLTRQKKKQLTIKEKLALGDNRFGERNDEYLQSFTIQPEEDDSSAIQIYVKMSSTSMNLCRLKSEMIVCCLQTFFQPFDNFDLMWVADIDGQIEEIKHQKPNDVFQLNIVETTDFNNLNALVYLPKMSATMLRHKDLCVLDTIAKTLGLEPQEVLFLPMDRKMSLW